MKAALCLDCRSFRLSHAAAKAASHLASLEWRTAVRLMLKTLIWPSSVEWGTALVGVEGYNEHVENSPSANRFRKSRGIAFEQFSDGNLWGSG